MTVRMPNLDQQSLPANVDAERIVLGSIMRENDGDYFASIAESLSADAFSLEKHRLIYASTAADSRSLRPAKRVNV
jgi:replicative DNA helicase